MRVIAILLVVLLLVPGWSGEPKLDLYTRVPAVTVARVALDPRDPSNERVGALRFLGGWHFAANAAAFGGFSAMALTGERFLLLGDGGNWFAFTLGADNRPRDFAVGALPAGPGSGWRKLDRDSESLARDPASGTLWVGFERWNAIWRYGPGFARSERGARPPAMADWPLNGGAEAMMRLADGRFVVLSERRRGADGGNVGLIFDRDPTDPQARVTRFSYRPPDHYVPTDIEALPDGRWLVLNRRARLPEGFTSKLVLADPRALAAGRPLTGPVIATLAPPLIHDNFEGLAVTREGRDTIVWMVSDDNGAWWLQRSLLLKFRLERPR